MRERKLVVDGQRIGYVEVPGRDPALLFLHGVGSNRQTWDPVLSRLAARGTHLITMDLPGHGGSGPGAGDYSLGAFASLARDLLDHLGVERAVLVGHSLGGGVSMQFAYQFPQRCAGLVLVASGGLGREASLALRAATLPGSGLVLPMVTHERTLTLLEQLNRGLARTPWPGPSGGLDDAVVALRKLQQPQTRKAFLASLRSVVDVSGQRVQASVARFSGLPVLVVWGDRDAILPISHGREAVRGIPGARLVVFPGASHEPHRFDPERFAELVLAQAELVRVAEGGASVGTP